MKKITLLFILFLGFTQFTFAQSTRNSSKIDKKKATTSSTMENKRHLPTKNATTNNNEFITITPPRTLSLLGKKSRSSGKL